MQGIRSQSLLLPKFHLKKEVSIMNFFQKLAKTYVHAVVNAPYAMSVGKGKTMPRD